MNASVFARRCTAALLFTVAAALVAPAALATVGTQAVAGGGVVTIQTLSNRADLISGGDALTRVTVPAGASAAGVVVTVNGQRCRHSNRTAREASPACSPDFATVPTW